MKILGLIPARFGSKGVPRKNIKVLNGIPLIHYSIRSAQSCSHISNLVVSTESEEIKSVAEACGIKLPYLRPPSLAEDASPTLDTVLHVLESEAQLGNIYDAVCLFQPTVPFRNSKDIEEAVNHFINSESDSLITVRKVPEKFNPRWVFEEENQGCLKRSISSSSLISRRQELPPAYYRDGSIYLTRTSIVIDHKSLYGDKIAFYEMKNSPNINIDTMEDWQKAVEFAQRNSTDE